MVRRIDSFYTTFLDGFNNQVPVGQGFECCTALGYQYKECSLQIELLDYSLGVIWVDIADELGVQLLNAFFGTPTLQGQIDGSWSQVTSPRFLSVQQC